MGGTNPVAGVKPRKLVDSRKLPSPPLYISYIRYQALTHLFHHSITYNIRQTNNWKCMKGVQSKIKQTQHLLTQLGSENSSGLSMPSSNATICNPIKCLSQPEHNIYTTYSLLCLIRTQYAQWLSEVSAWHIANITYHYCKCLPASNGCASPWQTRTSLSSLAPDAHAHIFTRTRMYRNHSH